MDQLKSYADDRLIIGCIYCSEDPDTRDHVPSRILLDEPYPENLPVLDACSECNQGFSLDEEYVACLIECARTGSVDAAQRPKIRRILQESPALAERLRQARAAGEGGVLFQAETQRIRNVVLKLARGHVAYELSEQKLEEPSHVMFAPLHSLTPAALEHFENPPTPSAWPEVGTRALQRVVISVADPVPAALDPDWIEVQEGRYRYFAIAEGPIMVRMVIGEYLACEVIWGLDEV